RAAIAGMKVVASNGPFLKLTVEGQDIGETVAVSGGRVHLEGMAGAPAGGELTRGEIYQNGAPVRELPITVPKHPALRMAFDVDVPADGWLLAVALGDRPLPTEIIGDIMGGSARPIAFTNPVWLDTDGDGKVTPPRGAPPKPDPWGNVAGAD